MGKPGKGKGKGKGKGRSVFIETNIQITNAANDRNWWALPNLLDRLCMEEAPLNIVNVSTILHRAAKKRFDLKDHHKKFIAATLRGQQCCTAMGAQHVGNALYGLQRMGDSCPEVRQLVAALTPKVTGCREEWVRRQSATRCTDFSRWVTRTWRCGSWSRL